MKALKKRRTKPTEKSVARREDELPWSLPLTIDPTFLPTSLYKTTFSHVTKTSLNSTTAVQSPLEPYYTHNNLTATSNSNSNSMFQFHPYMNSTRIMDPMSSSGYGSASACVASPVRRETLADTREASNSCPMIAPNQRNSFSEKLDISSSGEATRRPIGVFWDIENCSVPRGRSALIAVQKIRERFFGGHLEAEFVCVCDIRKEVPSVIQELNDAQISVVHVAGNSKNAADDKLRQAMRRFADISCSNPVHSSWTHPATIILISGDINFATDLSDLRYRKRLYIILLHNKQTPDALLLCAHEQYEFHSVLANLPFRPGFNTDSFNQSVPLKGGLARIDCLVTDLPVCNNVRIQNFVRNRLRKLSENCGGKVVSLSGQWALIRFPNYDAALRAIKRMNGEDVLGNKIKVIFSPQMDFTTSGGYQSQGVVTGDHENLAIASSNMPISSSSNKVQPGVYTAPSWKPTWKRHLAGTESFRRASSPHRQTGELGKYHHHSSATAQSNSSSPNDTSRDGSPNILPKPQCHNAASVQQAQLNNSTQYHASQVNNSGNVVVTSSFAFHQNLYPATTNMDGGGMAASTLRQECQTPPSTQMMPATTVMGGMATAQLYPTPPRDNVTLQPLASSSQHNFNVQYEAGFSRIAPPNNAILMAQPTLPYAGPVLVESHHHHPGASASPATHGNGTGAHQKYRSNNDGGETFELYVTNIDSSIGDWKTIRGALTVAFIEHVNVKGIWVSGNGPNDGTATAVVKLCSKEDAHYAVKELQRRKIGNKRIFISFEQEKNVDQDTLREEVGSLLQDVPNHTLPLFKFREMFEKRYKRSVSSSDLYRMKDVVTISENNTNSQVSSTPSSGRNITLSPEWKVKGGKTLDLYCTIHPPRTRGNKLDKSRLGWAEKEAEVMLPNVMIELKILGTSIHSLLQSHNGGLPLISFLDCYESEFGEIERATEGRGVPLEHLIACVQGVEIVFGDNGMKRIQWNENKESHQHHYSALQSQLSQLGRELIDLLKTFPKCTLPFAKLIPSFHAHFGRQCRVADYGHLSLSALLQTLPHIIQTMGAAQNRILTLSHRAQMKRFATDMLRVLKSQGGTKKQLRMEDFPAAFANVFPQRVFQPEDYGLCYFTDLVSELVEHSTLVTLIKDEDGNNVLAVPKREQTPQEIYRTRIFASEVVELLRHSTRCELEFSKFVPYYHHHFQKQCKVAEYGFNKLAELFDAINDTVSIISSNLYDYAKDDKIIRLTPKEQIKVVGEQICSIVEARKAQGLSTLVDEIVECFLVEHGFSLAPELCGSETVEDLVCSKLEKFVKVENGELIPVDRVQIEDLGHKAESILQKALDYQMELNEFITAMNEKCGENVVVDETTVEKDLSNVVMISEDKQGGRIVALNPLRVFACEMTVLLESLGGSVPLPNLENAYFSKFGRPLQPAKLGYPTVLPMLQAIPDIVSLKGKLRTKRIVVLNSVKSLLESSGSEESSSGSGKTTPRNGYWASREARPNGVGGGSGAKYGRHAEWSNSPKRRVSAPAPLPALYSPLSSPMYAGRATDPNVFSFDRATPLTPPIYDLWMQDHAGSPPMSPPIVWTCHPIYYPSSPPPAGPANIQIVTSPYVTTAPWSPPAVAANCVPAPAPGTSMLGNEFLFGQTDTRLTASFEGLTFDNGTEA